MSGDPVRAQYEALPYPERDPREERKRLVIGSPSHLAEVNHYLFAGRRDFRRPFRALVAGGGTGDALVMLAQQLADRGVPADVVYLDLSEASRRVAEARIAARGLDNVRFLTGSLLDLDRLAPGPYDYADCCGVLHHLEEPDAGLRALRGALAPDGGMGLMLYGALGRTGVYDLQAVLRAIAPLEEPVGERLAAARRLLRALPVTNRFVRNPFLADHRAGTDAGLYDLLLHARDRAYTVPEVAALCAAAGLRIAAFIQPALYDPDTYLADPALRRRLAGLPGLERAAIAELLAGNMKQHVVYAVPAERPDPVVAAPDSADAVPVLRLLEPAPLARALRSGALGITAEGLPLRFPVPRLAPAIVDRIDGRRSLGAIHAELRAADPSLAWEPFKAQFDALYAVLNGVNELLLAQPPAA